MKKLFICMMLGGGLACQPEAVEQRSQIPAISTGQNSVRTSGNTQQQKGGSENTDAETRLSTLDWDGIAPLTSGQFRLLVVE